MNAAHTSKPFTGRHMAMILIAFFTVVIGVNMVLVFIAGKSWTGLVVKNSYVASQSFNEDTKKLEDMAAMGIAAHLAYDKGVVTVSLADQAGNPLTSSNVTLKLGRAAYEAEDQTLTMSRVAAGTYQASATFNPGPWVGQLSADVDGKGHWMQPVRLEVKG